MKKVLNGKHFACSNHQDVICLYSNKIINDNIIIVMYKFMTIMEQFVKHTSCL